MKKWTWLVLTVLLAAHAHAELHKNLQAVTASGSSAWSESYPLIMDGIVTTDPDELLGPVFVEESEIMQDGQFQIFFQAVDSNDRGGTACWMRQDYTVQYGGNGTYSNEEWNQEMTRLLIDADTGRELRKGDRIEVTASKAMFYGGKMNINEGHRINTNDFSIRVTHANYGLPPPESVSLTQLLNSRNEPIFDSTRQTGGENWQGMRIRLDGVRFINTVGWNLTNAAFSARTGKVEDVNGYTFPVRFTRRDIGMAPASDEWVSVVGILNQEGANTAGYELIVQEVSPVLELHTSSGNPYIMFSADFDQAGYVLEATDNLADGDSWQPVDAMPERMMVIRVPAQHPNRNYRLRRVDH